jgi:hypothetical protein
MSKMVAEMGDDAVAQTGGASASPHVPLLRESF